jgi:uncharacterized protein YutE (UPF0331/DUF86 family)
MRVRFHEYLDRSKKIALQEAAILEKLHKLDEIEIRAARSSLQTLIENAIGKAKRILKHYGCPVVPKRSRDALYFLYDVGYFDDETYAELHRAVGFRNAMIHDYMNFDEKILIEIVQKKKYQAVVDFLCDRRTHLKNPHRRECTAKGGIARRKVQGIAEATFTLSNEARVPFAVHPEGGALLPRLVVASPRRSTGLRYLLRKIIDFIFRRSNMVQCPTPSASIRNKIASVTAHGDF